MKQWLHKETVGEFSFRVKESGTDPSRYYGEAIRGQFSADTIVYEPADVDCWFDMGRTAAEVLETLKAEVLQ